MQCLSRQLNSASVLVCVRASLQVTCPNYLRSPFGASRDRERCKLVTAIAEETKDFYPHLQASDNRYEQKVSTRWQIRTALAACMTCKLIATRRISSL